MLIDQFGDIENLLANLDQLKGKRKENLETYGDQARLSKQLVTLIDDMDLDLDYDTFTLSEPDRKALTELFKECEFHRLVQEFSVDERATADSADYRCVLTEDELATMLTELEKVERFAFDTETTGLNPHRAELVGMSFSVKTGAAWYIPISHRYLGAPEQLPMATVLDAIRPLLTDSNKLKIGQNLKYDILVLGRAGIDVTEPLYDTMLASYLANPASNSHGMDALASTLLDYRTIPFSEVAGSGKNQVTFDEVEVEKAVVYAAEDADITLRLYEKLAPMVDQQQQTSLFDEIEMPLLPILIEMEQHGIRVDADFLGSLSAEMAEKLAILEQKIHAIAGTSFNIASPKQLGEILFERLGLPRSKKTKTGWSTNVEVLTGLAEEHEIANLILSYRSLMKLKGTYTDALPKLIHPETGRIHTSFNQAITATGRLSSSDPNLQNIPIRTESGRRIREGFIPADGCVLLAADYSQVELRILAHMADVPALKESFAKGEDIHRRTASEVLGIFPEMVTDEQRRQAKAINFGVIYGMSAFGLAKQLGISRREAQAFIDTYFERYPGIRTFMDKCIAGARENLYVTTLLGRRCATPEINSKNGAVRGYAERNAINYPVQGSAADIIKLAMIRVTKRIKAEKLQSRMLLQVHDELVFEVPDNELSIMTELVREEMENAVDITVPLLVEVGSGANWREAH
jgi:DNA polymerase-1